MISCILNYNNKRKKLLEKTFFWGLITSLKITLSKVIKLIENMVVDHFVKSLSRSKNNWLITLPKGTSYSVLACYLWHITYGYKGLWVVRLGSVRLAKDRKFLRLIVDDPAPCHFYELTFNKFDYCFKKKIIIYSFLVSYSFKKILHIIKFLKLKLGLKFLC
jgi:hypothetical protein